jgi:CelD/BcsL family acetyltransferase involved in cellulose biosynthesis
MSDTAFAAASARLSRSVVPPRYRALVDVPEDQWAALASDSAEANAFFDPAYALPAARFARGGGDTKALLAFEGARISGLVPVSSAWSALGLPIPALVSAQPYSVLGMPLLRGDRAEEAIGQMLAAASDNGIHLLCFDMVDLDGPAMAAISTVAARKKLEVTIHRQHERAALKVPDDAEAYLRAGMGSKRLKELRRQRHRLDEEGEVNFRLFNEPATLVAPLDRFLHLEAAGWKGRRGTGLGQHDGDLRYITEAALGLSRKAGFEILEMTLGDKTIASGLVLRQRDTALFFKIAFDEAYGRYSPGVQLTVELTRRLVDDPQIRFADSCALPGHPMIDHVWRERRRIGNVLVATRPGPLASLCAQLVLGRDRLREKAKYLLHATRNALNPREKAK